MLELSEEIRKLDRRVLDELRTLGVQLAVDDVGLNHSNMDRLLDVRANVAKIDRRWLGKSGDSPVREHLVLMQLITLCDALGMNVIAEGVETSEHVDLLRQHRITLFQGFHFDRPLTRSTLEARLAANTNARDNDNNHTNPSDRVDSLQV